MSLEENDQTTLEYLERHNNLLNELKTMCRKLPPMYRQKVSETFLSDFANYLLDKTVFAIVSNLKEIQMMTEKNLLEHRQKLENYHKATKATMQVRHREAVVKEVKANPRNLESLKARQLAEMQNMDKWHEEELNHLDMKTIMDLDQLVSEQQLTLEKVGVPGFSVTNNPTDVKLQMYLLEFISELSAKEESI
ncbi:hypothetical protein JTE90_013509 [Oedothorax gibbosus]|uniref:Protein DGCR6 n=1 Tax=Oedothorax gibbosus TaxID=931172 RepID=A0AAV6VNS8_9ARAC|nr:hypothetical protein JTE90_013509 [Oedothorax gibbosus]